MFRKLKCVSFVRVFPFKDSAVGTHNLDVRLLPTPRYQYPPPIRPNTLSRLTKRSFTCFRGRPRLAEKGLTCAGMEFYLVSFKLGVPPHRLWPRAAGDDVLGAARHQGGHIHPPRAKKAGSLIIRLQYFWKFLLSSLRAHRGI